MIIVLARKLARRFPLVFGEFARILAVGVSCKVIPHTVRCFTWDRRAASSPWNAWRSGAAEERAGRQIDG